ncbi:MAG: hypothetical protein HYX84_01190 [Chloroflexi bacterium]|nr:hypothetical protein [Chloroflexota bacterium]
MKKIGVLFLPILTVVLLTVFACQRAAPVVPGQAADDVVPAPGLGPTYRANIQQQGVKNPWPPIQTLEVTLEENVFLSYRALIEMKRGETRNNIIGVRAPSENASSPEVGLAVTGLSAGIEVKQERLWVGPSAMKQLLIVEVSPNARPGEYTLHFKVEVNGKNYGEIPATVVLVR